MKTIIIFATLLAGAYAASYGGYSAPAEVRTSSYEAPVRAAAYEAPVVRSGYGYEAPSLKIKKPIVPIVRFNLNDDNNGNFNLNHESGDGTRVNEEAHLVNLPGDKEGPVSVKSGSYSYVGDDSKTYTVNWVADEQGFRATGDHFPTPPPLPIEHLRAVAELESYARGYGAPAVRTDSYGGYEAPVVRAAAYEVPVVRAAAYEAPVVRTQTYEAPAIRVVSSRY